MGINLGRVEEYIADPSTLVGKPISLKVCTVKKTCSQNNPNRLITSR